MHNIKTLSGWRAANGVRFSDYFFVGDKVGADVVDQMRDALPPACDNGRLMQLGEPSQHVRGKPTFITFAMGPLGWVYVGECFRYEKVPPRMRPWDWAQRCKDGDTYSYADNEAQPLEGQDLEDVIDLCGARGFELFADSAGLRVEKVDSLGCF